jgi:hypothetical protein
MKIALLICGQLRDIDFTIDSLNEYIKDNTTDLIDIFIATQDFNSIKPRIDYGIGTDVVNQYIILPIKYDIELKLKKLFGSRLKGVNIRKVYHEYISNQDTNLILKNTLGWAENFKELNICINMVKNYEELNNIKYDLFIKTRPDLIYCDKLELDKINVEEELSNVMYIYGKNDKYIWDTIFYMDRVCFNHMCNYYEFYMKFMKSIVLTKCKHWDPINNCEDHLFLYTKINKITTIDIGNIGYPLSWLIADIKNTHEETEYNKRFKNIKNKRILKRVINYTDECKEIIFDIKI